MTNQEIIEALEIGRDAAAEVACNYHAAMKGYRQPRHDALDADVAKIDAVIAALATQPQAPQGAVTDAERYQHLRNLPIEAPASGVDVAIWDDHCGESIRGEALDHLIDGEILKSRAAPETPEGEK